MYPSSRRRSLSAAVAVAATTAMIAAGSWLASGSAAAGTLTGSLYVDPNTQAARWVAANPNDSKATVIRTRVASQPTARWMSNYSPSTVKAEVSAYVSAAKTAGKIPVLSVYQIPNRDCGGASAGGAPDLTQYQNWITTFASALGGDQVLIILETDSIALQTCLSGQTLTDRNNALAKATQTIKKANSKAKVYLDGGHSAWNSASVQANRLRDAGIQYADGFYTNVSNFQPTAREASYGKSIISALDGLGLSGKKQVIDTSRNGGASGDWCADDNTDRRIGQYPTLNTNDASIDAYLWVKPPGEADGCKFTAGQFRADLAYNLASSAPNPSPQVTEPTTPPATDEPSDPEPSDEPSDPEPTQPGSSCSVALSATNTWQGGFQAQAVVTAAAPITGWSITLALASGQTISQLWNGVLTSDGSTATVTNTSWNGSLAASASTSFGFIGTGSLDTLVPHCTAS